MHANSPLFYDWTILLFVSSCIVNFTGTIVLEALILTSAVATSMTGYAFWAAKKGKNFSYLGPILFTSLFTLFVAGFLLVKFPSHVLILVA